MVRNGPGPETQSYDVDIVFSSESFTLVVPWTTDEGTDDEGRVTAATEWFDATFGFDPWAHCTDVEVRPSTAT